MVRFALLLPLALIAASPYKPIPCALPANLTAWNKPITANAGTLAKGKPVRVALAPTDGVTMLVKPGRAAPAGSHGAVIGIRVAKAGKLTIALSNKARVDLVKDGKSIGSAKHGRGPACSSLHKYVTFDVKAGAYLVQLSGSAESETRVLAVGG